MNYYYFSQYKNRIHFMNLGNLRKQIFNLYKKMIYMYRYVYIIINKKTNLGAKTLNYIPYEEHDTKI